VTFSGVSCDLRIHLSDQKVTWKKLEFSSKHTGNPLILWKYLNPFLAILKQQKLLEKNAVFSPKGFTFFGEIRFPLLFAQWMVERRSPRLAKRFRWHEEEGGGILYLGFFFGPTLRIQICSKKEISPIILFWGWD